MYIGNQVTNVPYIIDTFNGNATATTFGPLTRAPAGDASIAVYVNGLYKTPSIDYNVIGTQIFFTTAPASGTRNITILHLGTGSAAGVVADNTVTTQQLTDQSVTGPKIGPNAINLSNNIQSSTITGNLIATNTIRGNQIVSGTITGNLIATTSIRANQIVAGTITGNLIAANTIPGSRITTNTITGNLITTNAITSNLIATATITGNLFAANTITTDKIGLGAVSSNNLAPATITAITGLGAPDFVAFTSPGVFLIPSTISKLRVTIVGAGGGSGGARAGVNDTSSGQGGGGSVTQIYYNRNLSTPWNSANQINVYVGVGGNAGIGNTTHLTPGGTGNESNVFFYGPGIPMFPPVYPGIIIRWNAVGGNGSPAISGAGIPAITGGTTGNVISGQGGAAGIGSNYYSDPVGSPYTNALTLFYDGYRGNNGSYLNSANSGNVIGHAGQSFLGTLGMGAYGVRAAAPGANTPGLQGGNGFVLIEY